MYYAHSLEWQDPSEEDFQTKHHVAHVAHLHSYDYIYCKAIHIVSMHPRQLRLFQVSPSHFYGRTCGRQLYELGPVARRGTFAVFDTLECIELHHHILFKRVCRHISLPMPPPSPPLQKHVASSWNNFGVDMVATETYVYPLTQSMYLLYVKEKKVILTEKSWEHDWGDYSTICNVTKCILSNYSLCCPVLELLKRSKQQMLVLRRIASTESIKHPAEHKPDHPQNSYGKLPWKTGMSRGHTAGFPRQRKTFIFRNLPARGPLVNPISRTPWVHVVIISSSMAALIRSIYFWRFTGATTARVHRSGCKLPFLVVMRYLPAIYAISKVSSASEIGFNCPVITIPGYAVNGFPISLPSSNKLPD